MRTVAWTVAAAVAAGAFSIASAPAYPQEPPCTLRSIAGSWVFATGVGHIFAPSPPFDGQPITALGTMNIDAQGNVSGTFDNTIAGVGSFLNTTYNGTVELGADCRGTLSFTTSGGQTRTDSIVVLDNAREIWGMSRSATLPWTYSVRRILGRQ